MTCKSYLNIAATQNQTFNGKGCRQTVIQLISNNCQVPSLLFEKLQPLKLTFTQTASLMSYSTCSHNLRFLLPSADYKMFCPGTKLNKVSRAELNSKFWHYRFHSCLRAWLLLRNHNHMRLFQDQRGDDYTLAALDISWFRNIDSQKWK